MKTPFIKYLEQRFDARIDPDVRHMMKNNFVRSEIGYSARIKADCFNEMKYNFNDYFVKHYVDHNKEKVYHIIMKEENPSDSGITIYEFVVEQPVFFIYYTFDFDIYSLFFPNEERIIKKIHVNSRGVNFLYKVPEYEDYFKSTIKTQDEVILGLFRIIKAMPVGTEIAFERKHFLKESEDAINSWNMRFEEYGE